MRRLKNHPKEFWFHYPSSLYPEFPSIVFAPNQTIILPRAQCNRRANGPLVCGKRAILLHYYAKNVQK
jgi:hypothetical protein